jgi:hypothetical protein
MPCGYLEPARLNFAPWDADDGGGAESTGVAVKRTIWVGAVAIALVASACAAPAPGGSADAETATTAPSPAGSKDPMTTTTAVTTTLPDTTTSTTTAETIDQQGLDALVESLAISDAMVSGRVEGSMVVTGLDPEEAGVTEAEILFASAFDTETGDSMFMIDMSSMPSVMNASPDAPAFDPSLLGNFETRQIGDRVFLNFPFFTAMLGAESDWISMPVEGSNQFTSGFDDFPSEPGEILDSYEGANALLETIGQEEVNGVVATHYRISLETDAFFEQMTPSEREAAGYSPFLAKGVVPLDLWVSEDGYIVRMMMEVNAETVETSPNDEFGSFVMRFDMFDINEPVSVVAPSAADVTAVEDLDPVFDFDFAG